MKPEPHRRPPPWLPDLKAAFVRKRAELETPAAAIEGSGLALGRRSSAMYDDLLGTLYGLLGGPDTKLGAALGRVALAGVGGYGRGAVALRSDLDLRLLARDVASAGPLAEELLYPLWDLGVAVGHQVVTVDDLLAGAREDLPSATCLLDWRHIAGERALSETLIQRAAQGIFAHSELPRFMSRLEAEVAQRHERFGGSVYLLEPDVKNGPGGLRDLDIARWAARARYGVGEPDELVRVGALVPREALEIQQAGETLWRIRNLLHARAGRRSDRLTFDEQESIAPRLGYGEGGEAVERMMSEYYRRARTIARARDMILSRATPVLTRRRPHDEDLGGGTRLFDGCVTIGDAARLAGDPALALRVVSAAVDRGLPLLPYARDAIAQAASDPAWCAELRRCPEAASRFVHLVATCKETALRAGTVVRELHDLGLLLAMIPEFLPVVGRVHHDTYHVYTVDVHSVAAVDRLAGLARGELAAEFPLACRLAAETTRPAMLFFTTLLHDVGKAIGSRDHSERGAEMASVILARLGLPKEDVDEASHLIRKHLTMYLVATRRDLDDRAVIAELAREVHGREGLRDLYLLTVADLSTTSPTSMTSWKARMLDELYLATDAALAGDMAADDARVARAVAEVIAAAGAPAASEDRRPATPAARVLTGAAPVTGLTPGAPRGAADPAELAARRAFLSEYLASMPERYVLSNAPLAIVAHAELARAYGAAPPGQISVSLVPSRHPEAAEICVIAADRPGLLAAITAAIAASRLEVHAAQIHSRTIPRVAEPGAGGVGGGGESEPWRAEPPLKDAVQAVDIFWVRDRGEGVAGVARAIPKLVRDITDVIAGRVSAADLVRRRGASLRDRSTPQVGTQVVVDDRASGRHTVIEVTTRDRPGLLFAIADALYGLGLSIAVAKINTEGTRVADVFYVSEADGSKVASGPRTTLVHDRILAAIEEQARQHEGSSA